MEESRDDAATGGGRGGGEGGQTQNPIPNGNPNQNQNPNPSPKTSPTETKGSNGKSCKGVAYYSSVYKSKSKNPTCVGLSRTLHQIPPYVVGETELEASKEGRSLAYFKYACLGYSVYVDNKDTSADSQDKTAKLPFCVGLEVVMEEKASTSPVDHIPAPAHKTQEQEHATPQPWRYNKPPHATAEEYFNRFKRNANLVASGVASNLNRVGDYVKETIDDILYRRPK